MRQVRYADQAGGKHLVDPACLLVGIGILLACHSVGSTQESAAILSVDQPSESKHSELRAFLSNSRLSLGTERNLTASVRAGDLNGDQTVDIVVANGRHWPQQNFVLLNQGRARFNVMNPLGTGRMTTYACELADLNGDGHLDIAVGNDFAPCEVFLNDGNASFRKHTEFCRGSSVRSLTLVDIDQDADVDILVTSRGRQNRIFLNNGNAEFSSGPDFGGEADSTIDVAVGDVNGDDHLDLIMANRDAQQSVVLLNDSNLKFRTRIAYGSGDAETRAVAVADFDADGNIDWAAGNIGQPNVVHFGDGAGGVHHSVKIGRADSESYCVAVADMNRDGLPDIVVGNVQQPNSVYFNARGGEAFFEVPFGDDSNATYGIAVGDFDGDGYPDIVVADSAGLNRVFLNRPFRN